MDFFQFLQNSRDAPSSKPVNKTQKKKIQKPEYKTSSLDNLANEEVEVYKNISKGDIVKIIGVKGSILNSYKGYIGEVRDYKRDKETAMILLHAITYQTTISFPLRHFIKIDPFRRDQEPGSNPQD